MSEDSSAEGAIGAGYGCLSVLVFFGVWLFCTASFGGLGFMLGWLPAAILAVAWPIVLVLLVIAAVIVAVLIAIFAN